MPFAISILDETTPGERHSAGAFQFGEATVTLRDIIRLRVKQEVERFNQSEAEPFRGLVQPEPERILNGVGTRRKVDWEMQYATAVKSFEGNGFLVFIDNRQIMDLDEAIALTPQTQVAFLKLVPLMGG